MTRPDTPEILIPAIAANAQYVANLDKAAKKKPLTSKQKASRAAAVGKLDDYVRRYTALSTATSAADPFPGLSAADRNKAWDHAAARDEINAKLLELNRQGIADPKAQLEALGPELAGKALALGKYGSPSGPSSNNPDLDWALADAWGGYWNIEQGGSDADAYANLWKASELVKTVHAQAGVPIQNNQELGRAYGYNADNDGPA